MGHPCIFIWFLFWPHVASKNTALCPHFHVNEPHIRDHPSSEAVCFCIDILQVPLLNFGLRLQLHCCAFVVVFNVVWWVSSVHRLLSQHLLLLWNVPLCRRNGIETYLGPKCLLISCGSTGTCALGSFYCNMTMKEKFWSQWAHT